MFIHTAEYQPAVWTNHVDLMVRLPTCPAAGPEIIQHTLPQAVYNLLPPAGFWLPHLFISPLYLVFSLSSDRFIMFFHSKITHHMLVRLSFYLLKYPLANYHDVTRDLASCSHSCSIKNARLF